MTTAFIVTRPDNKSAIVAPPGHTYTAHGVYKENPKYRSPSPEWGAVSVAWRFKSHRAAARVANQCSDVIIREVH